MGEPESNKSDDIISGESLISQAHYRIGLF